MRESPSPTTPRPAERRELFCSGCGYGIVVPLEPPTCPMCRGNTWVVRRSTSVGPELLGRIVARTT
jgi:hypothetical protein